MKRRSRYTILAKGLERKRGKKNKSEQAYEHYLALEKATGRVLDWWFEPMSLRLSECDAGQPLRYSPDFLVLAADGTVYLDDVKAPLRRGQKFDDPAAVIRIKAAADRYPLFLFRIVRPIRGGAWDVQEV
jgi:hypothetical protein